MVEPYLEIDWRHDDFRQVRVHVDDELTEGDVHDLLLALKAVAQTANDVASLTEALETLGAERELRVEINTVVNHTNPIGNWVTVTLRHPTAWRGEAPVSSLPRLKTYETSGTSATMSPPALAKPTGPVGIGQRCP